MDWDNSAKLDQTFTVFINFIACWKLKTNQVNYFLLNLFRGFLEKVLYGTLLEMSNSGNFQTLIDAVRVEKEKKAKLQETILK